MSEKKMDDQAILEGIAMAARRELELAGELRPEQRLVEDLKLDSIHVLSLAMAVEDHFRIALDADDESGIEKVGDLIALVGRKLEERRLAGGLDPAPAGAGWG